jgi:hypothetical protein
MLGMKSECDTTKVTSSYCLTKTMTWNYKCWSNLCFPDNNSVFINTMTCYNLNFDLLKSRYDPGDELAWLEKELAEIE